jgi:hypothetical protein
LPAGDGIVKPGSLYAPGTAKNAIDVGASEGNRPPGVHWGGYSDNTWRTFGFQSPPISTDYMSDRPDGMTAFSSRGPTADGRIKPDIVAPGTNIISTLSQKGAASHLWGYFSPDYAFDGGTSIAAGFVSGAAMLARQWYQDRQGVTPSAALIKATLLNSAADLTPGQYGIDKFREVPERPNNAEGWGRLDVAMALHPPAPLSVGFADSPGLKTGESRTFLLRVTEGEQPLRTLLVWSDYAGAPDAGIALVNDLDLEVTTPSGEVFRGNGGGDRRNNVEGVSWPSAEPGVYRFSVKGYNVPQSPQPFALTTLGATGRLIGPGDVDGDQRFTVSDVITTLRAVIGIVTLTDDEKLAADVSQQGPSSGRVDLSDVTAMLRTVAGLQQIGE